MEELTNEIRLKNAYPVTDEVGENTKPFRFKLTNTCGVGVDYNLNLEVMDTENKIDAKNIAVKVDENNKSILSSNPSAIPTYQEEDYTAIESYTTYSGNIDPYSNVTHEIRIWLDESAGNDSQNGNFYSKVVIEARQNQTIFNQDLRRLAEIIETEPKYMDDFLGTPEDVNKIVASKEAMELIIGSDYLKEELKNSENYTDIVKKQIANSTVVSEVNKYNAGLPFYVFKNGNTGFTWSYDASAMQNYWCTTGSGACRQSVYNISDVLSIVDNSSQYLLGGIIYSQNLDLSQYNNLTFSYVFNGTATGHTSANQVANNSGILINRGSIWGSGNSTFNGQKLEATVGISKYKSASIQVYASSTGHPAHTINFTVYNMYVY